MIFDNLNQLGKYNSVMPAISKVLEFIQKNDLSKLPNGKYEIDGSAVFASINEYKSKAEPDIKWEAHIQYADIQMITKGSEKIGFAYQPEMDIIDPYNGDKDVMFLKGEGSYLYLKPGSFAIFWPRDAHKPGVMSTSEPEEVKKIVFKIKVA
jgi:YhcH/YjgK/YiaL family protein